MTSFSPLLWADKKARPNIKKIVWIWQKPRKHKKENEKNWKRFKNAKRIWRRQSEIHVNASDFLPHFCFSPSCKKKTVFAYKDPWALVYNVDFFSVLRGRKNETICLESRGETRARRAESSSATQDTRDILPSRGSLLLTRVKELHASRVQQYSKFNFNKRAFPSIHIA